jgi:hypothetical protein
MVTTDRRITLLRNSESPIVRERPFAMLLQCHVYTVHMWRCNDFLGARTMSNAKRSSFSLFVVGGRLVVMSANGMNRPNEPTHVPLVRFACVCVCVVAYETHEHLALLDAVLWTTTVRFG